MNPSSHYRCINRLCGADDCSNCHPENYVEGCYIFDETEQLQFELDDAADATNLQQLDDKYLCD